MGIGASLLAACVLVLAAACGGTDDGGENSARPPASAPDAPASEPAPDAPASEDAPSSPPGAPGSRALARDPVNGRYFADASGRPVYLAGSHTWWTLLRPARKDVATCGERPWGPFDYRAFLDRLAALGHNHFRLWTWEQTVWRQCGVFSPIKPQPWLRTGPGHALDRRRKFDLTRFDGAYFRKLGTMVRQARERGIYVSVMLFEGWGLQHQAVWHWRAHPFNPRNNVNGVNADRNRDGYGTEAHTLRVPRVTRIQERYVRRVLDTVGRFDNVLIEISNESGPYSTEWQYHLVRYVKAYQARRGLLRQPVGMTFQHHGGDNAVLHGGPADWIAPYGEHYMWDPPATSGEKVVFSDSDHHCGSSCDDSSFAWRNFVRGHNVLYMDTWAATAKREEVRRALGATRRLADRLDLTRLVPLNHLASTGYCLCESGREYVAYQPWGGPYSVDLGAGGTFAAEWIDPLSGRALTRTSVSGSSWTEFTPPHEGQAVLHLVRTGD